MGLYICHTKAIDDVEKYFEPDLGKVYEDTYQRYDVEYSFFKKYIRTIKVFKKKALIIYANDEMNFKKLKDCWADWDKDVKVFLINENEIINHVSKIELENNLSKFERHKKIETDSISFNYYISSPKRGFYTTLIGDFGKSVLPEFYDEFDCQDVSNFTSNTDFEKVYNLIGKYYSYQTEEDVNILKKQFKKDFLDQYEEGKSILSISY